MCLSGVTSNRFLCVFFMCLLFASWTIAGRSYYDILGVPKDAPEKVLKQSYRKLAKLYHPDKNIGNEKAAQKFKEVAHAYETLSDPEKRRIYDMHGEEGLKNSGGGGGGGFGGGFPGGGFPGGQRTFRTQSGGFGSGGIHFDFSDLFGSMGGMGGMGGMNGMGGMGGMNGMGGMGGFGNSGGRRGGFQGSQRHQQRKSSSHHQQCVQSKVCEQGKCKFVTECS